MLSDDILKHQVDEMEEEIAIEFSSLHFQNEMLMQEEEIDTVRLYKELGDIIDSGVDELTWSYIYPIIKECVNK